MRSLISGSVTVLLALTVGQAQAGIPASGYSVEDLGILGKGFYGTRAYAINASGVTVGYSAGAPCTLNGFVWNGTMQHIPDGTACSSANAINTSGQIAVSLDRSFGAGCYHAIRLTGGQVEDLGASTFPDICSDGYAINDSGQVAGRVAHYTLPLDRPVLWTGFNLTELGSLGGNRGWAVGINSAGQVVGVSALANTPTNDYWNPGHAFLWDGGIHDLNPLNQSPGWELRMANDINDRGQIVGYGVRTGQHVIRAYRLELNGLSTLDLGTFPNGGISYAKSVNEAGDVVGAAYLDATGAGNYRAFVYTNASGMRNLNDLIPASEGWILREATGINSRGQIVGWGDHNGEARAFRLTPKPSILLSGTSYHRPPTFRVFTVLGVQGSYFTPNGAVEIRLLGQPSRSFPTTADAQGEISWGTTRVSCGVDIFVQAEDVTTGAMSDQESIFIDCP